MIQAIKNLFRLGKSIDFKVLKEQGAQIVDVRTIGEYEDGHINGSINIPLDTLIKNLSKLNKNKHVITCCASGMRSASAKSILKSNGFTDVHNGGGWRSLGQKIS